MADYRFISTDPEELISEMVSMYETIVGVTVQPGSPERLFIQWVAAVIIQARALINYAGNQNIPSRATGENLDALAELVAAQSRPEATASTCTMEFRISEAQNTAILVPMGTRISDTSGVLVWATTEDLYIPAGETSASTTVTCQTVGTVGNGYAPGQISKLVDLYDYYSSCVNITTSDGGSDTATDEEFRELLRLSMDAFSCAGASGGYIYFAKQVSTEIIDVSAVSPAPGQVNIYILTTGGIPAGEELKSAVGLACSSKTVRPLTDNVNIMDPEIREYDIDLTYYISSESKQSGSAIAQAVEAAVAEYVDWQASKLGRDINPSPLYKLLMMIDGMKRVEIRYPVFTVLPNDIYVARLRNLNIVNGGEEDE